MFDWVRDKIGGPSGLEAYSQTDLEVQAESIKTEMKVKENDLKQLDDEFRQKIQEAANAPATSTDRIKMEARTIKQNYEQQEAAYQAKLKEYAAMQTLVNAKRRLKSSPDSALQEMSKDELESFKQDVMHDVIERNKDLEGIEEATNTINETLTAISGPGSADPDDELDTVIETVKQGGDVSDVTLADLEHEESHTASTSLSLSELED